MNDVIIIWYLIYILFIEYGEILMQIKLKRSLIISMAVLTLTLLLTLPVFRSHGAGTVFSVTTDSSVEAGEIFIIDLIVTTDEGFAAFDLDLHYSNTSLELIKIEFTDTIKAAGNVKSSDKAPYKLTFAAGEDFAADTSLAKLTFKLTEGASLENHEVYVTGSVIKADGSPVDAQFRSGGVVAVCSHDTDQSLWKQFNYTEATCTTPSQTYYRCSECQQQKTVIGTTLKPHEYKDHEHKDATCVENGYDKQICKNCQKVVTTKTYEATGHKFSDVTSVIPPTCMAQGYTVSTCTVCSEQVKSDYTDKIAHDMKESSRLSPTCQTVGYIRYTCTVCAHQSEDVIETVDHSYEAAEVVPPSHINKGYTIYRCKYDGCNHSYNDDYTDILPHTFEYTVVKEPTCTEAGFKTGICTEGCNVTDDVEIPATGHSFGNWYVAVEATHFYDGYEERACLHCQYKETKLIAKLTDDPNAGKQEPKSAFEKAVLYITDANHPAIIAVSLFAVIIAIVCIAYIIIKIRITR